MEHFQIIVLFVTTCIIPHCAKAESNKETILYLLNNTAGLNRVSMLSWGLVLRNKTFRLMLGRHANMPM